jgi:hypothetical protein
MWVCVSNYASPLAKFIRPVIEGEEFMSLQKLIGKELTRAREQIAQSSSF